MERISADHTAGLAQQHIAEWFMRAGEHGMQMAAVLTPKVLVLD